MNPHQMAHPGGADPARCPDCSAPSPLPVFCQRTGRLQGWECRVCRRVWGWQL